MACSILKTFLFAGLLLTNLILVQTVSAGIFDDDPDVFDPDFESDNRAVVEDLVDISIIDRKVLAIIEGQTIVSEELGLDEDVLFQETAGLMGLVMTNKRLLAISTFTSNWVGLQLNLAEVRGDRQPKALISDFLILVITSRRLLGFDSNGNEWIKSDIELHDNVITAKIDKRIAVVVTTDQAVGLAQGSAFFDSIRFMKGEQFVSLDIRPLNANVLTSKRLLIFRSNSVWKEFDKDFY